jgi:hypothetical protein
MVKQLVFVGGSPVSSECVTKLDFRSDSSLIDGDIIIFSVDTSSYNADFANGTFQGRRCLDDDSITWALMTTHPFPRQTLLVLISNLSRLVVIGAFCAPATLPLLLARARHLAGLLASELPRVAPQPSAS